MLRIRRVLAVTAIAAAVVPVLPIAGSGGAASGQELRHRIVLKDGPGDVWECSAGDGSCQLAGNLPSVDILGFRATHGRSNVRFRMVIDQLEKVDGGTDYWVRIKTKKLERLALVETGPGHWTGHHYLMNVEGDPVKARGFTHRVDYDEDTVTMVIPRDRLGGPRWIRVSAWDDFWPSGQSQEVSYGDNPMNHDPVGPMPVGPLTVRLYRS